MFKRVVIFVLAVVLGGGVAVLGLRSINPKQLYPAARNHDGAGELVNSLRSAPSFDSPRAQLHPDLLEGETSAQRLHEQRAKLAEQDKQGLNRIIEIVKAPGPQPEEPTKQ